MRKRIRKVHLRTDKTDSGLACNSTVFTPLLTSDLNEVTCNCCVGTDIFKDVASEKERERPIEKEEFKEPDLFTKYNLNSTHKAFIEECGEVEAMNQNNKNCFGCCFHFHSMNTKSIDHVDCTGVKCIENKVKFRLKKEEIMSDKTEISINDGTPGKQLSCYFSKLSVGDYFLYHMKLYRKTIQMNEPTPLIESVITGNYFSPNAEIYKEILKNTVEMVEKVTIQYIRKEQ